MSIVTPIQSRSNRSLFSVISFIARIEVDDSEVKVYYTIPMPPYSISEETVGVLLSYTTVEGEGDKAGPQKNLDFGVN